MDDSHCVLLNQNQIYRKEKDGVLLTTSIMRWTILQWPCNAGNDTMPAACRGATFERTMVGAGSVTMLCQCIRTPIVLFPIGVEETMIGFEHAFEARNAGGGGHAFQGSTGGASGDLTKTTFAFPNGSEIVLEDGSVPLFSLGDWLVLAGVQLDQPNMETSPDFRNASHFPLYRHTGVAIEAKIYYSNGNEGANVEHPRPYLASNYDVTARVVPSASGSVWTGEGMQRSPGREYVTEDGIAVSEASLVLHYGVRVTFVITGQLWQFSWLLLVSVLGQAFVFLQAAKSVTNFVALNLLPQGVSTTLQAKCVETVRLHQRERNAERAMKTALAAAQFNLLDENATGKVDALDLMHQFASVNGVSAHEAVVMTEMIMNDQGETMSDRAAHRRAEGLPIAGIDMTLSFEQFTALAVPGLGNVHDVREFEKQVREKVEAQGQTKMRLKNSMDSSGECRADVAEGGDASAGFMLQQELLQQFAWTTSSTRLFVGATVRHEKHGKGIVSRHLQDDNGDFNIEVTFGEGKLAHSHGYQPHSWHKLDALTRTEKVEAMNDAQMPSAQTPATAAANLAQPRATAEVDLDTCEPAAPADLEVPTQPSKPVGRVSNQRVKAWLRGGRVANRPVRNDHATMGSCTHVDRMPRHGSMEQQPSGVERTASQLPHGRQPTFGCPRAAAAATAASTFPNNRLFIN